MRSSGGSSAALTCCRPQIGFTFSNTRSEAKDVPINEHLTECYRPNNFLRDFNVVDTPGTNTIVAEHQRIAEEFVPMADLVLFVFSITNPWAASAWEFPRSHP